MNDLFENFLTTVEAIGFRFGTKWEDGNKQTYFYSSFFQDLHIELPIKETDTRIKLNISRLYKNMKENRLDRQTLYNGFIDVTQPYEFLTLVKNLFPTDFVNRPQFQEALNNHAINLTKKK